MQIRSRNPVPALRREENPARHGPVLGLRIVLPRAPAAEAREHHRLRRVVLRDALLEPADTHRRESIAYPAPTRESQHEIEDNHPDSCRADTEFCVSKV